MKKYLLGFILPAFLFFMSPSLSNAEELNQTEESSQSDTLVDLHEDETERTLISSESEVVTFKQEGEQIVEEVYSPEELSAFAINSMQLRTSRNINFINEIGPLAKVEAKNKGLYASVMIAQSILESGWGTSKLSNKPYNNLFGIKGEYNGNSVVMETKEYIKEKDKWITTKETFKVYPNRSASLRDNGDKLRYGVSWDKNFYSGTWIENTQSYKDATAALTGTYATDPSYNQKLNNIIETYNLIQYDSNYGKPEKEVIKKISKDVSIKPGMTNNVHSRPYPYEGYKIIGTTVPHQGIQVHVSEEAKTSNGIYLLADGIGWIHATAFTDNIDTLTKKSFKRFARIKPNTNFNFYTAPYNTKGAQRNGLTTREFYGNDVQVLELGTNNRTKEEFYLVKDKGWLPTSAFNLIYDEETIKNISEDVSIKPGASNNIHSRPYPYYGFKITGNTKEYNGKQVHISKEAKTSNGTYYLADNIGWIHSAAFTNSIDELVTNSFNRHGKIKSGALYNFYKAPYNTLGAERTGNTNKEFYGKDVEIIQKGTNRRTKEIFYNVKGQGWIPKVAFSLIYDEEQIKDISKEASIKTGSNNNIHSRPYPYYGFKVTGTTKKHNGEQVHISKEAKTSNGTYYLADGIGWIRYNALTTGLDTLTKKRGNPYGRIKHNTLYNFYTEPYNTKNAKRTGQTTQEFYGKAFKLMQKATNNRTKEVFYLIQNKGWLPKAAFDIIYDEENIVKTSKDLTIASSANNNIHSRPYPYYGFKITGNTKSYLGKQIHISEQAVTSNGTYYLADDIGWIRVNAFTKSLDSVNKSTFKRDGKVLNKTFYFYTEPYNTKNSQRTGQTTNSIKNKDVVLTQKATSKTNGNIYYYVQNFGWIDQKALLIYDVPNYETINIKVSVLPNISYNVHTKPYPYKGFKVIGKTSSMKMNGKNFTIKRQAHTSNGIYYEVPGYGWVNKKAFSTDAEKYKQVQNLLNRKYSSSNFGIFVKSVNSNSSAGVFADTQFTAASTGKLPAIYYTQKRYNNKTLNPNTKYLYTDAINQMNQSYGRGGAGVLQSKPFGGMYSIDTILNWTIYYSDNQGANFLGYYAANKFNQPMKQEISQIIGRKWDSPFSITARENAKLMEAIYKQGGNANKYLQNTSFDNQRIPKYLPVKVGHKIGDVFDYRHDVAIVYAKEPYVLSVMTKNYQSYETISQLSLEIYNILK